LLAATLLAGRVRVVERARGERAGARRLVHDEGADHHHDDACETGAVRPDEADRPRGNARRHARRAAPRRQQLLRATIVDLKKYNDPSEAMAAGYRSIGDAVTGDEHFVNWSTVNDGHILDPTRPESLCTRNRRRQAADRGGDVHAAVR